MIKYFGDRIDLYKYAPTMDVVDDDILSPKYFRIAEFPKKMGVGKNLLRLNLNLDTLVPGADIFIEALDSNNNPLYYEVIDYVESDNSRLLAFYVYEDTPPGEFKIYLATRTSWDKNTGRRIPYSNDNSEYNYINYPNLLWVGSGIIQSDKITESDIIYARDPRIEFTEVTRFLKETSVTGSRSRTITPSFYATYYIESKTTPLQFSDSIESTTKIEGTKFVENTPNVIGKFGTYKGRLSVPERDGISVITLESSKAQDYIFTDSMVGGTLTLSGLVIRESLPNNINDASVFQNLGIFSSSIVNVINNKTVEVYPPIQINKQFVNTDGVKQQINIKKFSALGTSGSIKYQQWPSISNTKVSQSFLHAKLYNLEPSTGYLDSVRISYKPFGSIGEFTEFGVVKLSPQNLFVDTGSIELTDVNGVSYYPIGNFSNISFITGSWRTLPIGSGQRLLATSSNLNVGLYVSHSSILNEYAYIALRPEHKYSVTSAKNTEYTLTFNVHAKNSNIQIARSQVDVYISGSSILRDDIVLKDKYLSDISDTIISAKNFGTKIGTILLGDDTKIFNKSYSFIATTINKLQPYFVIRSGNWTFSNIRLGPRYVPGYSPNYYELLIPIDRIKKNTEYVFKLEYLNQLGKPANIDSKLYGIKLIGSTPEINLTDTALVIGSGSAIDKQFSMPFYDSLNQKMVVDNFVKAESIGSTSAQLYFNYIGKPPITKAPVSIMGNTITDRETHFDVVQSTDTRTIFAVSGSTIYIPLVPASSGGSALQVTTQGRVYYVVSDSKFKTAIEPLNFDILEKVLNLNPVKYAYKDNGKIEYGFLAEEVEKIFPEYVDEMHGNKVLDYAKLTSVLTKAIQELYKLIKNE